MIKNRKYYGDHSNYFKFPLIFLVGLVAVNLGVSQAAQELSIKALYYQISKYNLMIFILSKAEKI